MSSPLLNNPNVAVITGDPIDVLGKIAEKVAKLPTQDELCKMADDVRRRIITGNHACRLKSYTTSDPAVFFAAMVALQLIDTMAMSISIPTACVSVSGLEINPIWASKLTTPELNFVILHEVLHVHHGHLTRGLSLNHEVANMAGDLAINDLLSEWSNTIQTKVSEKWPFDKLISPPADGLYVGKNPFENFPRGKSLEWYYNEIMKNCPPPPPGGDGPGGDVGQPGGQPGQNGGQSGQNGGQPGGQSGQNGQMSQEEWDKHLKEMLNKMRESGGEFQTQAEDMAKQAIFDDAMTKQVEDAAKKAAQQIEKLSQKLPMKGGLTQQKLDEYLSGGIDTDAKLGKAFRSMNKPKQMTSATAQRGVDGLVERADDEGMWRTILSPLQTFILTDVKRHNHRRPVQLSIASDLTETLGEDVFLRGRIFGPTVGGEVLVIVDTSGSTCDYWMLSIAKCLECLAVMSGSKIVLRCVMFSDQTPSIADEYLFWNSGTNEEEDLSLISVIEPGKEVMSDHVIDVSPFIDAGIVEIQKMVGEHIQGGGGTCLVPVVNSIRNTVGDQVNKRFLVTVIITDADLYGGDEVWARSSDVVDTFGDHVSWLFLDLYGVDYSTIVGENKYLIKCR